MEPYNQLLDFAISTDNKELQKKAYIYMADAYEKIKDIPQAINCYEEWLKLPVEHDGMGSALVYVKLGNTYQHLGDSHEAIKRYERSLEIAKELPDHRLVTEIYMKLGDSYFNQKEIEQCSDCYEKGLECAIKWDIDDLTSLAYCNLAILYEHTGDYTKTIEHYEKALGNTVAMGDKENEAVVCEKLGEVYNENLGDYPRKAIEYHERQLQISVAIDSKSGQARAYRQLGTDYQDLKVPGNYHEAIKYGAKGLEICIEIGDKQGEAAAHLTLGVTHKRVGQYKEAIAHSKNSLEIAREIGYRPCEGKANAMLGDCLLKKYARGQYEAVEYYEESLKIAVEEDEKTDQVLLYGKIGWCKAQSGEYSEAMELYKRQIRMAEKTGRAEEVSMGFGGIGLVYFLQREYNQAIYWFEKQLEMVKATNNKFNQVGCYFSLGKSYGPMAAVHKWEGELEKYIQCTAKSIQYLREGIDCCEWLEHNQEQDHLKISIFQFFIKCYNYLSVVFLYNGMNDEALVACERGRARALDDLLVTKYSIDRGNQSGRKPICYAEIDNMASNFSILFYSVHWDVRVVNTWVVCSGNALVHAVDKVDFPQIVQNVYDALKVREIKCENRLIQTDEHQTEQELSLPQMNSSIMNDVSAIEMIMGRCILPEDLYDGDSPLEGLYNSLISPVLDQLTKDEIVIIPDRDLFMVPFAALRDPSTRKFLSETKRIRLAPSLTSLKALEDSPADFHSKTGALIIGNPKVGEVMFKGMTRVISDLPCAEREAKMIGELLGVKPFIGPQATKETIKQNLREGVAIIHFAAHGTTDGEIFLAPFGNGGLPSEEKIFPTPSAHGGLPSEEKIFPTPFAHGGLPSEQDYILTMKDVQESGVRPQLVVLSCCHSGRGDIKPEGVVGMSRAFLAASPLLTKLPWCLWRSFTLICNKEKVQAEASNKP